MITLRRLDLVRQDSQATAEELASLQTQLNSLLFVNAQPHLLGGTQQALPTTADPTVDPPHGYFEFQFRGRTFVLPFYEKG